MEGNVTFEIELMAFCYCTGGSAEYTLIGLLSHDQRQMLRDAINYSVDICNEFVAVRYYPGNHSGIVFISKELYQALEILKSEELFHSRQTDRDIAERKARRDAPAT